MTRDNGWHIATASLAAFGAGVAAGAYWMQWRQQQQRPEQQQQQQPAGLDLRNLQRVPSSVSPTPSVAGSVCYSLPPTPRFNGQPSFGRSESFGPSDGGGDEAAKPRMVFVVRKDLGWGKQRLAVMTAHVALGLFKKLYKSRSALLPQWEAAKGPKLVLRADDESGLLAAMEAARDQGLPCHSIAEATGNPECPRTRSILAIGPLTGDQLSSISSGLVLL